MYNLNIKFILGISLLIISAFSKASAQTVLSDAERQSIIAQIMNEQKDSLNNTANKPTSKTLDNFQLSGYLEIYY
ncbi:MAG: hypothetical protein KBE86_12440, partial [Chitinophagales bacterium]|nr:hypothetical protein [Chitinophagales bacterium]